MKIIFNDISVMTNSGKELLNYKDINNISIYKLIDFLIENEKEIEIINQTTEPLSQKLFEIITEEFSNNELIDLD